MEYPEIVLYLPRQFESCQYGEIYERVDTPAEWTAWAVDSPKTSERIVIFYHIQTSYIVATDSGNVHNFVYQMFDQRDHVGLMYGDEIDVSVVLAKTPPKLSEEFREYKSVISSFTRTVLETVYLEPDVLMDLSALCNDLFIDGDRIVDNFEFNQAVIYRCAKHGFKPQINTAL